MNPLELPGPDFLVFYVVTAVVAVGMAVVLRWVLCGPGDDADSSPRLSTCEIAYLADGRKRAVNAAVARLVHEKCLTLGAGTGTLTIEGELPKDAEPFERAVYRKVSRHSVRVVAELYDALIDETDSIRTRLENHGLLVSAGQALVVRSCPILVIVLVLLLGIAKLAIGIERDKPVSFLVSLLVILGASLIGFTWKPFRSRRGNSLLAKLQQDNAALQTSAQVRPEGLLASDLSLALGLFGVGVLSHDSLTGLRQCMAPPSSNAWTGSSGCGSGGGGGGCGGGGGGGGGCGGGGCGGCGGG